MDLEHERRLTEVEARSESNTKRLNELERKQSDLSELVGTVKVLATREEQVETDVKEIKNDVKMLTNKSAKKWDNLMSEIIKILVGVIMGVVLAKIGL